ncbi:MAG: ABC transporter substrate-binding protein [Syntrophobacteraceae bacterium]|jgi:branched-chain amino acid transport system substrate-binding protein
MRALAKRPWVFLVLGIFSSLTCLIFPAPAEEPVNIVIIAESATIVGKAIVNGAQLASGEINAKGGVNGRPIKLTVYDDQVKSAEAVQAFQRAVYNDHANAVVGSWISEIALSLAPWSARLHTIYITTGAASPKITQLVHDDYNTNKYVFQLKYNAIEMAQMVCSFAHDDLVQKLGYKTAYVASENAAWTEPLDEEYLKCLPSSGLKVVGHMRFSKDTDDFTPIFATIEKDRPDLLVTGWAHVGLKPTVQWHEQQVPVLIAGVDAQASTSDFWAQTNGATEGIITQAEGSPSPITPKTIPFVKAYEEMFHISPSYAGYTTYDTIYVLKNAMEKAKSVETDAVIEALEATSYTGVIGNIEFYDRTSPFAHGIKFGKGLATGVVLQWQKGELVTVWPKEAATGSLIVPSFVQKQSAAK